MARVHAILLFTIFFVVTVSAQTDTTKWVRAFPITDYVVKLNDSLRVVQLFLPDGPELKEKQTGLLKGVYTNDFADTITIGMGRCHLIKGEYYYFSINTGKSKKEPVKNDLLYTIVPKPNVYKGQLLRLASHFIELQNVYESPIYDCMKIFEQWSEQDEAMVMDSIVQDIKFTGDYFIRNNPSMNQLINSGDFKGGHVLNIMKSCKEEYVKGFFEYILVRPRLYAGRKWKISEIFATWLISGAPTVSK